MDALRQQHDVHIAKMLQQHTDATETLYVSKGFVIIDFYIALEST